ncbi:MAG: DUF190 domain-containing protein [Ktedonobacterales bacterium]
MPWVAGLTVRVLTHERAFAGVAHAADTASRFSASLRRNTHTGNGQSGRQLLVEALVALVQRRQLAGITITRALEGSETHGRLRAAGALELGEDLPIVVEIVDRAERIEALLPEVAALVTTGALTVSEVRLYIPATRLQVRDVMQAPAGGIAPDAPLGDALHLLLEGARRLAPVVDDRGVLVGVLTLGRLLEVGERTGATVTLAQAAEERVALSDVRKRMDRLVAGRTVRDVMLTQPLTVRPELPLDAVGRALAQCHLTRAPVVDGAGRLVGMVSERAIVAALVGAQQQAKGAQGTKDVDDRPLDLRLCVLPGAGEQLTAAILADPEALTLPETTGALATIQACEHACGSLALIVGADGRLVGVVDEDALLAYATRDGGAFRGANGASGLNRVLLRLFFHAPTASQTPFTYGPHGHPLTARDLMRPPRPLLTPQDPAVEALALMEREGASDGACDVAFVVGADGRPYGALWRHDVVRVLLGG